MGKTYGKSFRCLNDQEIDATFKPVMISDSFCSNGSVNNRAMISSVSLSQTTGNTCMLFDRKKCEWSKLLKTGTDEESNLFLHATMAQYTAANHFVRKIRL